MYLLFDYYLDVELHQVCKFIVRAAYILYLPFFAMNYITYTLEKIISSLMYSYVSVCIGLHTTYFFSIASRKQGQGFLDTWIYLNVSYMFSTIAPQVRKKRIEVLATYMRYMSVVFHGTYISLWQVWKVDSYCFHNETCFHGVVVILLLQNQYQFFDLLIE